MPSTLRTTLLISAASLLAALGAAGTAQAGDHLMPLGPFNPPLLGDGYDAAMDAEEATDMAADAAEDTIMDAAIVAHDMMEDALDD
jgi:hypothetical protein